MIVYVSEKASSVKCLPILLFAGALWLTLSGACAQQPTDSLRAVLKSSIADTSKLQAYKYMKTCFEHFFYCISTFGFTKGQVTQENIKEMNCEMRNIKIATSIFTRNRK